MNLQSPECGILLRPLEPGDTEALHGLVSASRESLSRWLPWCHSGYSRQDAAQWISQCSADWRSGSACAFGIFDAASNALLGNAGVNRIVRIHGMANLGYWVGSVHGGRGIAVAASRLVARFAFGELGLTRLEIVAAVENRASRRVAEKLGAQLEAEARNRLLVDGVPVHAAVYSLIPSDL